MIPSSGFRQLVQQWQYAVSSTPRTGEKGGERVPIFDVGRGNNSRKGTVMKVGILNVFFSDRNYGFVHEMGDDGMVVTYFLHGANIKKGVPKAGAAVRFQEVTTRKGLIAIEAEILEGSAAPKAGA